MDRRTDFPLSTVSRRATPARVLIIEQDQASREALTAILRPFGDVVSTQTVEEAFFVLVQSASPEIVIVSLHGTREIETLDSLKGVHPWIKLLVLTEAATLQSTLEAYRHGALAYLLKPVHVKEFVTLVQQLLNDS